MGARQGIQMELGITSEIGGLGLFSRCFKTLFVPASRSRFTAQAVMSVSSWGNYYLPYSPPPPTFRVSKVLEYADSYPFQLGTSTSISKRSFQLATVVLLPGLYSQPLHLSLDPSTERSLQWRLAHKFKDAWHL